MSSLCEMASALYDKRRNKLHEGKADSLNILIKAREVANDFKLKTMTKEDSAVLLAKENAQKYELAKKKALIKEYSRVKVCAKDYELATEKLLVKENEYIKEQEFVCTLREEHFLVIKDIHVGEKIVAKDELFAKINARVKEKDLVDTLAKKDALMEKYELVKEDIYKKDKLAKEIEFVKKIVFTKEEELAIDNMFVMKYNIMRQLLGVYMSTEYFAAVECAFTKEEEDAIIKKYTFSKKTAIENEDALVKAYATKVELEEKFNLAKANLPITKNTFLIAFARKSSLANMYEEAKNDLSIKEEAFIKKYELEKKEKLIKEKFEWNAFGITPEERRGICAKRSFSI